MRFANCECIDGNQLRQIRAGSEMIWLLADVGCWAELDCGLPDPTLYAQFSLAYTGIVLNNIKATVSAQFRQSAYLHIMTT